MVTSKLVVADGY